MTTRSLPALCALPVIVVSGCRPMSEVRTRADAGLNGGFEVVVDGLPANWSMYSPATIPTGDYDLVSDTVEVHEGRRSLRFDVRACSAEGGWRSPGFTREIGVKPGVTYVLGFWVRNERAEFVVRAGGVTAEEGRMETIVRTAESTEGWRRYTFRYTVPEGFDRIRFEVNVLAPGVFWIDGVTLAEGGPGSGAAGIGHAGPLGGGAPA